MNITRLLNKAFLAPRLKEIEQYATRSEALQNQFTTAAFPTNAFLWLDNPEKVGWWGSMDMAMPQEVVDWMENTARNHPDVVKTLSSPGLASAYIPDLKPDSYLRNTFYYYRGLEFLLNQRFHPLPQCCLPTS